MIVNRRPIVALFGTCKSNWREAAAIPALTEAGIAYFNPIVADWNEQARQNEIEHARLDAVILSVITGESTGFASLAESGWLAWQAFSLGQLLILVIEDMPAERKPKSDSRGGPLDPNGTRDLVKKHIRNLLSLVPPSAQNIKLCPSVPAAIAAAIHYLKDFPSDAVSPRKE